MKKNIFLIGFMGAGKSLVARTLHSSYGMELIEMDEEIEAREGMTISRMFAERGEEYFRNRETELLRSMRSRESVVVSCGGGVPMRERNVKAMRESGIVVYLSAKPETIYERVKDKHNRPLLEGNMNVAYIGGLLEKRLPKYLAAADATVVTDGRTVSSICGEIMKILEKRTS